MSKNYLSWDQYFMGIANLSALRSKDPSTGVGACVVNDEKRIVSIGYNGLPKGYEDESFHWTARKGEFADTKYPYVVHAEANAIVNTTTSLKDCSIYVTLFPCNECAKLIVQSGIKEVVYLSDKYSDQPIYKVSKQILQIGGVSIRQTKGASINVDWE